MSVDIRVDRANSLRVPCGMDSILYLGGSIREAIKVFNEAEVGLDSWGQPNASYGVVLSVWDEGRRDYVIKCRKGIDE